MVGAGQLIALKTRVWLDLTERARRAEQIDSKTVKKYKNDVCRLLPILVLPVTQRPRRSSRRIFANSSPECAARMLTSNLWAYASAHTTVFW